jgi:hypothetical protein
VSSNELTSFELFVQPYPWVTEPIWRRRTDGGGRGVRDRGFTGKQDSRVRLEEADGAWAETECTVEASIGAWLSPRVGEAMFCAHPKLFRSREKRENCRTQQGENNKIGSCSSDLSPTINQH